MTPLPGVPAVLQHAADLPVEDSVINASPLVSSRNVIGLCT